MRAVLFEKVGDLPQAREVASLLERGRHVQAGLIGKRIGLDEVAAALAALAALAEMDEPAPARAGVTVAELPRP